MRKYGNISVFSFQIFECILVVIALNFSFTLASDQIYNGSFPFGVVDGVIIYTIISALAIIVLGINRYFSFKSRTFADLLTKVLFTVIFLNFAFIALLYFSRSIGLSPYFFIVADTYQILFLVLIKQMSVKYKEKMMHNKVCLVIGGCESKTELLYALQKEKSGKMIFVDCMDEHLSEKINEADFVYVASDMSKKLKDEIICQCIFQDKMTYLVPATYEIALRKAETTQVGDIPVFSIDTFRLSEAQNFVKRCIDIIGSFVGIVLTSPIMLIFAIRIKKEDGGPIFFKQIRSGRGGEEFEIIKFRTMVPDAEKYTGAVLAQENDPRITNVGRFMRATRIDEIPQFFNVLMGSMSLVGPRPERPVFVKEFAKTLPEFKSRLLVKPGITGLAQVMGNYTTTPENKVKFDLMYIRSYCFLLDVKILFKTIKVVFTKEQAEGVKIEVENKLEEKEAIGKVFANQAKRSKGGVHIVFKASLAFACCVIILFGCTFLRYSSLVTTVLAASGNFVTYEDDEEAKEEAIQTGLVPDSSRTGVVPVSTTPVANTVEASNTDAVKVKSEETQPQIILTQEDINRAIHEASMGQKIQKIYGMVTKISAKDLLELEEMSRGGFTVKEKERAKEMMHEYYNEDEVKFIYGLYREYVR